MSKIGERRIGERRIGERRIGERRIGTCRHLNEEAEQIYDGVSQDALDENGWLCLHDEKEDRVMTKCKCGNDEMFVEAIFNLDQSVHYRQDKEGSIIVDNTVEHSYGDIKFRCGVCGIELEPEVHDEFIERFMG